MLDNRTGRPPTVRELRHPAISLENIVQKRCPELARAGYAKDMRHQTGIVDRAAVSVDTGDRPVDQILIVFRLCMRRD